MRETDSLFSEFAESLAVIESTEDLDELPEGSIIYSRVTDRDGGFFLVKNSGEKLYLGNPCEWYTFTTLGAEILLLEDVFPWCPPAFLIVRGEEN